MKLFKKHKTSKVIFSANIDLNYKLKNKGQRLSRNKTIYLPNQEMKINYSEIEKLMELNNYKLKKNFKEFFGVPVFRYL